MGNSIKGYRKVKFNPEKMKVEARLYFQDSNLDSKVFFRVIPQRERYRFKEHEFIEVYVNDNFIARGREETLKIYNTICIDVPEYDFKSVPYFSVRQGKETVYIVKQLTSGEFVLFFGNIQTLFFITNSVETLRKVMPEDSDYQYIINGSEQFDNLRGAINRFSEIV